MQTTGPPSGPISLQFDGTDKWTSNRKKLSEEKNSSDWLEKKKIGLRFNRAAFFILKKMRLRAIKIKIRLPIQTDNSWSCDFASTGILKMAFKGGSMAPQRIAFLLLAQMSWA